MRQILFFIRYLIFVQCVLLLLLYYEIGLALLRIVSHTRAVHFLDTRLGRNAKSLLGITGMVLGLVPRYLNHAKTWDIPKNKSFVIVSNHQSLLDILIISAMFEDYPIRFILKESLKKGFIYVSNVIKTQNHATIDRNNPKQSIEAIKKLRAYTKEHNFPIILFPEGTRSRDGNLKAFKTAGLKTLLRNNPMPVVIVGTHNGIYLPTFFSFRPFKRNRMIIKILHIYPEVTMRESEKILDESRILIQKNINNWKKNIMY